MSLDNFCDSSCTKCNLHKTARKVCIPGKGAEKDIKLLIVGEAPGTDENQLGECFIGKAGQLLQDYLSQVDVDLEFVRFENLVRCFPQDEKGLTRQPTNEEARECLPYFYSTLTSILADQEKPPTIVALGNFALKTLTGNAKITTNRGTFFPLVVVDSLKETFGYLEEMNIQIMGAIHPSAVLRGTTAYEPKIIADLSYAWKIATDSVGKYWYKYKWMEDPNEFSDYVDRAIAKYEAGEIPWIAYDLETTGLEVYDIKNHKTVCFSLCMEDEKAIVVPLYHKDCPYRDDSFVMERVLNDLKRLLSSVPIAGWGLVFDVKWTKLHLNIDIKEVGFDGYLARRWLHGSELHNDLNSVAAEELNFYGHGNDIWSEVKNLPKESQNFSNVSKDTLLIYAGGDADATFRLCKSLEAEIATTNTLESFKSLSIAGVLPICKMEINGVYINEATNAVLRKKYPEKMEPLVDFILNTKYGKRTQHWLSTRKNKNGKPAPLDFNIASSASLQRLIFEEMGMPIREAGKSGPAANREIVEELIEYCNTHGFEEEKKILEAVNEWRTHKHTYTNFIKNIPEYTQWDGFFHTQYNIAGTETGRFSTSKPSLHGQQKGSEAREQFVSRWIGKGGLIVSGDMAQMEMRVLAALSGDKALIEAIRSGIDLHTANASKMFKIPTEQVDKKQRDHAKRSGFGVVYGIGAETLATRLECNVAEAQQIINIWYETFPDTLIFQKQEFSSAKKFGCVYTPFGRFRVIHDISTAKWGDKAWRRSINTNIQSSASDITYTALLHAYKLFEEKDLQSKIFGFVHDSIIVDVYPGELWEVLDVLKKSMVEWTNETYEWMKNLVQADFEICTAWGLPCTVDVFEKEKIEVHGSERNVILLDMELKNDKTVNVYDGPTEIKTDEYKLKISRSVPF